MKKITIVVLSFLCLNAFAQTENQPQTLFGGGGKKNIQYVLNPYAEISTLDDTEMFSLGVRGGVNINTKYTFGAYYFTSLNDARPSGLELVPGYFDVRKGGAYFEYTLFSDRLVHFTFPLNVGYGEIEMDNDVEDISFGEEYFFAVEPSALVEINLFKYLKANAGVGHRWVSDFNYLGLNANDLRGVLGQIGLKAQF
jgi:hypothetical protein